MGRGDVGCGRDEREKAVLLWGEWLFATANAGIVLMGVMSQTNVGLLPVRRRMIAFPNGTAH